MAHIVLWRILKGALIVLIGASVGPVLMAQSHVTLYVSSIETGGPIPFSGIELGEPNGMPRLWFSNHSGRQLAEVGLVFYFGYVGAPPNPPVDVIEILMLDARGSERGTAPELAEGELHLQGKKLALYAREHHVACLAAGVLVDHIRFALDYRNIWEMSNRQIQLALNGPTFKRCESKGEVEQPPKGSPEDVQNRQGDTPDRPHLEREYKLECDIKENGSAEPTVSCHRS